MQEKIGRYEIKAELGRGGMATVYLAYDPRAEREVAIKVLPREMLHDPRFRTRFEREAKTIALLEHPAIVPVYDFGEEDGQPYFVMRYMTGGSLSDHIKQGPQTIQETARIFNRLAPALDDAHAKGIIHRDLKPGNILFDQHNEPYISDFGIAKLSETQTSVTGSAIIGTPAYMSPEQAQGESVDGRADIYALGIILFELLTGRQPYEGDTPMSVVVKHITEPVPHILDVKSDLPPAVESVVEKAMAKNKDERFATVSEMAAALNDIARGKIPTLVKTVPGLPAVSAKTTAVAKRSKEPKIREQVQGPAAKAEKPRRTRRGLWVGLGLGGLFVCAALGVGLFLFKDHLPFLGAAASQTPEPTASRQPTTLPLTLMPSPSNTPASVLITDTPAPMNTSAPTDTPTLTSTLTSTPMPTTGGADLIAFLNDSDIWLMSVNGSGLRRLTTDGSAKHDLQWSPDGQEVIYISGKRILAVNFETQEIRTLAEFIAADFLEAFEISPDGSQVAISLNRELYVVPFNLEALSKARSWQALKAMNGCFTYNADSPNGAGTKGVRWSKDGKKIAVQIIGVGNAGQQADYIRVFDIRSCAGTNTFGLDTFPGTRFLMNGYNDKPVIPSFNWNGETLFLLNSFIRNEGFGYLYVYNMETHKGPSLDPLDTGCCYRDASWSPDGTFVIFAYQNINRTESARLYYIPYGSIGTGAVYTPLDVPADFWQNLKEKPQPVLRPAQP